MNQLFNGIIISALLYATPTLTLAEPIKIGLAGPFSGPYASFGDQLWHGASQAAEDINKQGGINGNKIELIKADDACEPKQAVNVANRLTNDDKVNAVIGHFCSSSTLPASNVYSDAQIIMITPASTNPAITDRNLPMVFRTCGRDDQQGIVGANFIHDVLKAKRVAVIHDQDTYGKGLADATKAQLEKRGTKVVLYEGLTRGEKDFNALATKIKQAKADAIYFGGLHPEAGPFLRQLREQEENIPFISGDGIASQDFVISAGGEKMVNGVYMTFGEDPRNILEAKKIVNQFRTQHYEPESYTLYTYAALQAIAQAMTATHSKDGKTLSDWLKTHQVKTVIGNRSWDNKGDLKTAGYVMYKWNDKGKYEVY